MMRHVIKTLIISTSLIAFSLQASEKSLSISAVDNQTYSIQTSHGNISVWDTGGNGKPVLFVHGNSFSKEIFQQQFQSKLAKKYRFIAIDLPGHGQSQKAQDPEKTYNLDGYAETLIEVIKQLGLENRRCN